MSHLINILIQNNPRAIESLDESDQTPEICLTAVTQDGYALRFVKKVHKDFKNFH